ncbi:MAG TPA: MBL fold metallo-hydrolase [Dehalococcoidia bacterium]|nr:MBL fold metallo-hydrolase [Dehalococcoidia bacterium]
MEIVWLGHACFRLRGREATLVTDPCPPSTGYAIGKPNADVVTVSHYHEDHSYLKGVGGTPKVIDGPGEYEVHGAFVTGIGTYHDRRKGEERGANVVFVVEMEEVRVCHLGDLGHTPTPEQVEEMSGVDVLLVPVGGLTTLDGTAAAEVVNLLEPRLVIPMHYRTEAVKDGLEPPDRFLREMGAKALEPQPKLSVTATSLPHETQVVLLDYRR